MNLKSTLRQLCLLILTAASACNAPGQGNLTPPPDAFRDGVPFGNMKTLNEVEPRVVITSLPTVITNSGSYYLINSLRGTNGIFIDADDVTIDLGGFGLSGTTNNPPTHGIEIGEDVLNVTIKNGIIGDWGGWGIYGPTNADFFRIQDLTMELNGQGGLMIGPKGRVERVIIQSAGGDGIVMGNSATVIDCKVAENDGNGISVGQASTITSCIVTANKDRGIEATTYATIKDCTINGNWNDGIIASSSCRILDNNIGDNGQVGGPPFAGIHTTGPGNQIKNNNLTANNRGIRLEGKSNWIEGNGIIDNNVGLEITGTGNFVIRNCVGNPSSTSNGIHFAIAPSNQVAEIFSNLSGSFTNSNPWGNTRLTPEP